MAIEKKIDYVILGLLSHEDLTGYEIKKRMDKIRRQLEENVKLSEEKRKQMNQELDATAEEIEELQAMLEN